MNLTYVSKFPDDEPVEVEVIAVFAKVIMLSKVNTGGIIYVSIQFYKEFLKGDFSELDNQLSKYKIQNNKQNLQSSRSNVSRRRQKDIKQRV